ncbi:MAG TPA: GNAT family N-acetyltransferase [Thermoleophilaceae bacterium]|nr:GNAT family N-acetyltransferase [Thermoleophilaceae bacterium]
MDAEATRPLVRRARDDDEAAAVPLLFASGGVLYERYAGSRAAALRLLSAAFRRPGNNASAEVVWIAERDGRVAGVMAAFPVVEGAHRARSFLALSLTRLPPWRWLRAWRVFHGLRPTPPTRALYVDALATAPDSRRAGVGSALLAHAVALARERGCTHLALETEIENAAARALYRSAGFEETDVLPHVEPDLGEGYVCLVRPLVTPSG